MRMEAVACGLPLRTHARASRILFLTLCSVCQDTHSSGKDQSETTGSPYSCKRSSVRDQKPIWSAKSFLPVIRPSLASTAFVTAVSCSRPFALTRAHRSFCFFCCDSLMIACVFSRGVIPEQPCLFQKRSECVRTRDDATD